ncbi:MAG: AAA family ATPase [Armatimonadota bacterium]|nr:AAA family ATPase [Armatimonadota bacterium]
MKTTHETLIGEALLLPKNATAYSVTQELCARYPGKGITYGSGTFDWESFLEGQQCTTEPMPGVLEQLLTSWNGKGNGLSHHAENGWYQVQWQGNKLDVLLLSWHADSLSSCKTRYYWILAEDRSTSEAFLNDLCEWNAVLRGEVLVFDGGYWRKSASLFDSIKSFKSRHATDHDNIHNVFRQARETIPCILILEDLDSLIDGKNRSFFLNELDGFAANTGVVVLATTNHPERLDPAILDRPSRFDRKYHFQDPGPEDRLAYLSLWNGSLEAELRLSEGGLPQIAEATDGFSFAYLKELFLSSMMHWINAIGQEPMDAVMLVQAKTLREQMSSQMEQPSVDLDGDDEMIEDD